MASTARGGMQPADIGRLAAASDPRLSPDGHWIVFVLTTTDLTVNRDRSVLWVAPRDGSQRPRPFGAGASRETMPRWAPDGRSIAYVVAREQTKTYELVVAPFGVAGEARTVTVLPDSVDELAWSPDGESIAYVARVRDEDQYAPEDARDRPPRRVATLLTRLDSVGWVVDRHTQLFVVAADGTVAPRQLTTASVDHSGVTWSPAGGELAFSAGYHDGWDLDLAADIWRIPAMGGDATRLTTTGPRLSDPSWSPDGELIACYWNDPRSEPRHTQVAVVPAEGGDLTIRPMDRNCAPVTGHREPVWGDDGSLLYLADDRGDVRLYDIAGDVGAEPRPVVGGTGTVTGFDVAAGVLAFTATTATSLPELYVRDRDDDHRRTRLTERFTESLSLGEPERFLAGSPDGAAVDAWILRPAGFENGRRYPALLNVHGGPYTQYGNRFFDEFQAQAGAGYVVVFANPRGSAGYSEQWARAIRAPVAADDPGSGWGGVDYDDLMAVVDEALRRFDFIDPDRLGVLGGSYGGYMASWIVGHTDRFRAACSERSVNDLAALELSSDFAGCFRHDLGVSLFDAPDEYARMSPITYVRDIRTPLLILHSEDDLRCPIDQAERLFVALRLLGRDDVEFWRFPGESHELSRSGAPRHRVRRQEIILDFFGRHLGTGAG